MLIFKHSLRMVSKEINSEKINFRMYKDEWNKCRNCAVSDQRSKHEHEKKGMKARMPQLESCVMAYKV